MSRIVIIGLFGLAGAGFLVLWGLSRRENSKIPSFGRLTGFVMAYQVGRMPVGRIALLGFWWWAGWHFFAR
jgi:Family of unknown function (DUF6186)